jgi:hypothetical protein
VVSMLATGAKVRGFKAGRSDGLFKGSTHSFGWEVKPEAPRRKILLHVKIS